MSERKYEIKVSEKQVRIINAALDLYSRLLMGQWEECVLSELHLSDNYQCEQELRRIATEYKARPSPNGFYGISNERVHDNARTAWDMQQVFRHRISWDNEPKGGWTVNFDKPMQTNPEVELAKIEKVDE
jgi:hypothetical protein